MREFFTSGRAVDLVLAVLGLEVAALGWLWARRGRGVAPLDLLGLVLPGALLLGALRCALTGADVRWTAVLVTASFPAHLFDLVRRARAQGPPRRSVAGVAGSAAAARRAPVGRPRARRRV
ncbi:MAG: hypothetical protein U1A78_40920 [Polyangia bacterium]